MQLTRSSYAAALIAVSAATGAMLATTGAMAPASADATRNTCGTNHACGYDYVNYGGREFFDKSVRAGQVIDIPNDMLGSVSNRTGHRLCIQDWNGTITVVAPHSGIRDLGNAKNKADKIKVQNAGQHC